MKIIGHHTCSSVGNISTIEKQGPFLSTHVDTLLDQHKFLGTGYYYWDNNLKKAHNHGQKNYRRKYYIFESELDIVDVDFLDLAGNRSDMLWMQEIMQRLQPYNSGNEWNIGSFIEFLKKKNLFNFRAVRAVDNFHDPQDKAFFVSSRSNFINLNPVFIVCLMTNGNDIIKSFKHIRTYP